jgi:hypothetical protein
MQKLNSMTELSQRLNEVDPELVARKQRQIAGLRYKLYIFLIVVGLLFFRGMFAWAIERVRWVWALPLGDIFTKWPFYVFLEARGEGGLMNDIELIDANISWAIDELQAIQEVQKIIVELNTTGKQYTLANCVNEKLCNDIKPKLMENLPFFRTYIILSSLESPKMDFDQKVIIKSVLEYLLMSPEGTGNGKLLWIQFGSVSVLDDEHHLYKLPFSLEVEFANKQNFLSFLTNVEQKINFLLPIVYKIEWLNYSIVEYKFEQTVKVDMIAYYYNPPIIKAKPSEGSWDTTAWTIQQPATNVGTWAPLSGQ